jgi:hypothetical protein
MNIRLKWIDHASIWTIFPVFLLDAKVFALMICRGLIFVIFGMMRLQRSNPPTINEEEINLI